jgi:TatA/E family protein of Tat protein translocase
MPELLIIFVIALVVFGPRRLPELGRSLGRAITEFRRAAQEFSTTLEEEVERDNEGRRSVTPAQCAGSGGSDTPASTTAGAPEREQVAAAR